MNKCNFFVLILVLISSPASSETVTCSQAIMNENLAEIYEVCFVSGNKSILESVDNGLLNRNFGSFENMTKEASLIKSKAELGDPSFQYLWSNVINYAYIMGFDIVSHKNSPHLSALYERKNYWQKLSAENGFLAAMAEEINDYLSPYKDNSEEKEKVRIMRYAKILIEKKIPEAEKLIARIEAKETSEDIEESLSSQSEDYRNLPTYEIKMLAHHLKSGSYYGDMGKAEIQQNINKSKEMYEFLSNERKDGESAYFLAKIMEKTDKKLALKYFFLSAELGFPRGLGWKGDYLSCNGNNKEAIKVLKQAKLFGYMQADDSLGEIEEHGTTINCYNGWIE